MLTFCAVKVLMLMGLVLWAKKKSSGGNDVVFELPPVKADGDDAIMVHLDKKGAYPLARCKKTNEVADPRWLRSLESWPRTRRASEGWT